MQRCWGRVLKGERWNWGRTIAKSLVWDKQEEGKKAKRKPE